MLEMRVKCWPVGQGLFMTGRIWYASGRVFDWVYDCGSTSGVAERDLSIASYRAQLNNNHVDLVTLSHFDADHINGIVALLKGLSVGHLLLPYVPLWKRLLIALRQGTEPGDSLFGFFIDPVSYLSREIGEGLKTVAFVPEALEDDVAPPSDESLSIDDTIAEPYMQSGEAPAASDGDPVIDISGSVDVQFLRSGGGVVIPHLWEFVPFNDPGKHLAMSAPFERWCVRVSKIFAKSEASRAKALEQIRRNYTRFFG